MSDDYPKDRPQLFALHYIRWLIDAGVVNEIGPDAFALLVAVVMREDDLRYQRAPNFFNEQLMRTCGIGSEPALIRARKRAVDADLLIYRPGAKRRPGVYFVFGFANDSLAKAEGIRRESAGNRLPSIPNPIPTLIESAQTRKRFKPPTVDEVASYCRERGNEINPQRFLDFYEANGWTQGKGKPIRDWKAAVRTWEPSAPATNKQAPPPRMRRMEDIDR